MNNATITMALSQATVSLINALRIKSVTETNEQMHSRNKGTGQDSNLERQDERLIPHNLNHLTTDLKRILPNTALGKLYLNRGEIMHEGVVTRSKMVDLLVF